MENRYIVSARKWRPQTFNDVVGQKHITQTLMNALQEQRIAHAYLFTGPRGVGKTTLARILAKAIRCETAPATEPCNQCQSCKEITSGTAIDVLEIDGASNRGIDEIRELRERIRYAPSSGKYKLYIIDEVHMLTSEAFNALLKTLEEPPAHVIFIFATTNPNSLPATIRSRCQRFDFKFIAPIEIETHLKGIADRDNITIESGALKSLTTKAAGSLRDALSLFDQAAAYCGAEITTAKLNTLLGRVDVSKLVDILGTILDGNIAAIAQKTDAILQQGTSLEEFTDNLIELLEDVLKTKLNPSAMAEKAVEIKAYIETVEIDYLLRMLNYLIECRKRMRRSDDSRLILELTMFKLANLPSSLELNEVITYLKTAAPIANPITSPTPVKPNVHVESTPPVKPKISEPSSEAPKDLKTSLVEYIKSKLNDPILASHLESSSFSSTDNELILGVNGKIQQKRLESKLDILQKALLDITSKTMLIKLLINETTEPSKNNIEDKPKQILTDNPTINKAINLFDGIIEPEE